MSPTELIVDSFAGGGGASEGIYLALGRHPDIAINHDREAIALHAANHPESRHFPEDVWEVDPVEACAGRPVGLMWLSPDCKHFSKAKGGQPVSPRVRGLAWVTVRWANAVRPRVIVLENVEEFQEWGPLHRTHSAGCRGDGTKRKKCEKQCQFARPIKSRARQTFNVFVGRLRALGYEVQHRELRACDYGAPTIRKRLFLIARCDGQPIVWPAPTHGKPGSPGVMAGKLRPWRSAAECIDWSIPVHSIFLSRAEGRALGVKRPLVDATMRRIARGVKRYVLDNPHPFLVQYYSPTRDGDHRVAPIDEPLRTQTTENRFGVVVPYLTEHANSSTQRNFPADEPLRTQCASVKGGHFALVAPHITKFRTGATGSDMREPMPTVTANGFIERPGGAPPLGVVAPYLIPRYGERDGQEPRTQSVEAPLSTIVPTQNGAQLVAAFMAQHNTDVVGHHLTEPVSTIVGKGCTQALVHSHLLKLRGSSIQGQLFDEPAPTITAGGTHLAEVRAFLVKYYGTDQDPRLEEPLSTVTTKHRFGLVIVDGTEYVISDIGMRMLVPRELYQAQGFRDNYQIEIHYFDQTKRKWKWLTKTAQVRMVGNSVCPPLAEAIVRANVGSDVEALDAA